MISPRHGDPPRRRDKRLERELAEIGGDRVKLVKDPVYSGSDGGLAIALDAPDSDWEELGA